MAIAVIAVIGVLVFCEMLFVFSRETAEAWRPEETTRLIAVTLALGGLLVVATTEEPGHYLIAVAVILVFVAGFLLRPRFVFAQTDRSKPSTGETETPPVSETQAQLPPVVICFVIPQNSKTTSNPSSATAKPRTGSNPPDDQK